MERKLKEWELRDSFMRAYKHSNSEMIGQKNIWGLVKAKQDFQRFLEKLKTKIFTIEIPEGVEVPGKDICDYYSVIPPKEPSSMPGKVFLSKTP